MTLLSSCTPPFFSQQVESLPSESVDISELQSLPEPDSSLEHSSETNQKPKSLANKGQSTSATGIATREISKTIRKIDEGKNFVAVTANRYATDAAKRILERGGTAIDAAIAAQMVLGLVEPQSSGLGGGGFLLYWDAKNKKLHSYDGRETAPSLADENLFLGADGKPISFFKAIIGGRSVGVPGLVKMLELAHSEHGRESWPVLFEDAIFLAGQGFSVSERLHALISKVPALTARKELADYLFLNGSPLQQGYTLRNTNYAKTLEAIAIEGSEAFYDGAIANAVVKAVSNDKMSGALSVQDMNTYQAKKRTPVCKELFDYKFCGMGPPSSGGITVLAILALMENIQAKLNFEESQSIGNDVLATHAFIEASRLAFADRYRYIADPDFVDVPVQALLNDKYLQERAALFDEKESMISVSAGQPPAVQANAFVSGRNNELPSTTHLSIVDSYGNVVSLTTSIETAFGSRLMVEGFILNNQLTDFSFAHSTRENKKVANRVQGGKRPTSSMAPMIIFDKFNQPVMAIGSPGGRSIIPYVARVLYETLAQGRSLEVVVAEKHVVHTGKLRMEIGSDVHLVGLLREKGHQPELGSQTSGLHVIQKLTNGWLGVADLRREGTVARQ